MMRITNMTWQCYQVELLVEATLKGRVYTNVINPLYLVANCLVESFYITSAVLA